MSTPFQVDIGEVFGPDDVGKRPGMEICIFESKGYQICRITSKEQAKALHSTFNVQYLIHSVQARDAVFLVKTAETKAPAAVFVIQQFKQTPDYIDLWQQSDVFPKSGIDSWSLELLQTRQQAVATEFRHRPLSVVLRRVINTFLFDYLGLNPNFVRNSPRIDLLVPAAVDEWTLNPQKNPWFEPFKVPPGLLAEQMEAGNLTGLAINPYLKEMNDQVFKLGFSEPLRHMIRFNDRFLELDIHYSLGTHLNDVEGRRTLGFQVRLGSNKTMYFKSPMEAVVASGIVATDMGVADWIEREALPYKAFFKTDMLEAFQLVNEEIPPLRWPRFFLRMFYALGGRAPW